MISPISVIYQHKSSIADEYQNNEIICIAEDSFPLHLGRGQPAWKKQKRQAALHFIRWVRIQA